LVLADPVPNAAAVAPVVLSEPLCHLVNPRMALLVIKTGILIY
jgi:hypothetical protein